MSLNDDSWESVSAEENEEFEINLIKKNKIDRNEIKNNLFIKILSILKKIDTNEIKILKNENKFLNFVDLKNKFVEKDIIFSNLIHCGILSKLFILLKPNEVSYGLHVFLPEIFEQEKIKTNGLVLSLSSKGDLINETILYSSKYKFLNLFDILVSEIKPIIPQMSIFQKNKEKFENKYHDQFKIEYIFKKIPNSLNKLIHHPLYVIESNLKRNEYIHPKRPVLGYFKGNPVYLKQNVKKLFSENGWFKKGRKIKNDCQNIFRKVNDKKLYRIYETEEIEIDDISDKIMKYFHKNHIPKKCCYISDVNAHEIAKLLKIKYAQCITGFKYKNIVIEGIFCYEKDKEMLLDAISEFNFNTKVNDLICDGEEVFSAWKMAIKKVKRFFELKEAFE